MNFIGPPSLESKNLCKDFEIWWRLKRSVRRKRPNLFWRVGKWQASALLRRLSKVRILPRQFMKECKWCENKFDDVEAYEKAIQSDSQYFWDTFRYCSEECCRKDWDLKGYANNNSKM